jgi:hypothetical protein
MKSDPGTLCLGDKLGANDIIPEKFTVTIAEPKHGLGPVKKK